MSSAIKYDVFLSYCWQDRQQVGALADKLKAQNLRVFLERWHMPSDLPWPRELARILASCNSVAICLGRGETDSWRQREIHFALERQQSDSDFPVIPVLLPGSEPALSLLGLNLWIDLRQGLDQSLPLSLLAAAIRRRPLGHDFQARIKETSESLNPYKGLAYFREEDASFFYGREEAVTKLTNLAQRSPWVAVVGNSGCGKSSLIRAGLVSRSRHEVEKPWEILTVVPGDSPLFNLTAAFMPFLYPGLEKEKRMLKLDEQRQLLAKQPGQLRNWIITISRIQPTAGRFLLVVDQWEELYLGQQRGEEMEAAAFINALMTATEAKVLSVVLAVRADFTGHVLGYRPLADRLQDAVLNLGPMNQKELRLAIEKPAERMGRVFEDGLVEQLLNDAVKVDEDSLPLLEFALHQLWEDPERGGDKIRHQAYTDMQGLEGALNLSAEQAYRSFSEPEKKIARQVMEQLVRSGHGGFDLGKRRNLSGFPAEAAPVINHLIDKRLLAIKKGFEEDQEKVEPAHEALIRQWKRIRNWLIDDRQFDIWRAKLGGAREAGEMLKDYSLTEARRWRRIKASELDKDEREFIDKSHKQSVIQQFMRAASILLPLSLAGAFALWVGTEELLTPKLGIYVLLAEAGVTSFIEPEMVDIPSEKEAGQKGGGLSFTMGPGTNEKDADKIELPAHRVTLSKPFRMSRYEITFDQYQVFAYLVEKDGGCADKHKVETLRVRDENWGRGQRPAINVSWNDALCYAQWLSKKTGAAAPYRLPTEAEWEFAARAGTESAFWWGDTVEKQRAVCDGCGSDWQGKNERRQTAEVDDSAFKPNGWGLYHTSGNVWEWVQDCWHENYDSAPQDGSAWDSRDNGNCGRRVLRGGSWVDTPVGLRSAYRYKLNADYRYYNIGFRLARDWD
ncbi:MAG: nSTAND1 domain-containing NTPase [Methylosarcina sp.]